jgi:hypothetical protein
MTYLQLVNAVLTRLRESSVTSVQDTSYSRLIGAIVNEAKRDIEEAWNWSHLRTYATITTVAGTDTYSVAGTTERTRILDAYNSTTRWMLSQYGSNVPINNNNTLTTLTGSPASFDVVGIDTADSRKLKLRLYPTPSGVESIRVYCVVPQDDLSDDTDEMSIPSHPVVQGAYLRAINERGEDQGRLSEIQQKLAMDALADAIAIDASYFQDETVWRAI